MKQVKGVNHDQARRPRTKPLDIRHSSVLSSLGVRLPRRSHTKAGHSSLLCALLLVSAVGRLSSQTLNVPARPIGAPTGSEFINIITPMSLTERENWIYAQAV